MKREKLSVEDIEQQLAGISGWALREQSLAKRFEFPNFAESLAFVNKVGEIADAADHHPDIKFGWGYAEIETTTHDRGGVTGVDFDLVAEIDRL